jgi:hypothetical protein
MMAPRLRKLALTIHLVLSLGWIGAVVVYLVLGISAVHSTDVETIRAAWIDMELAGWSAIVPLAIGSLATGIIMSLGTPWGLFRHYWVLITFALTTFCVAILLLHMPSVSAIAQVTRESTASRDGHGWDLLHPSLGLVLLLVITLLNVYKPPGVTSYGWRKQREKARAPKL